MTEAKYEARIRRCRMIAVGEFLLGIAVLFYLVWQKTAGSGFLTDAMESYYSGTGIGLAVVGVMMFIKKSRILKDEKKMKERKLIENDERNCWLRDKTMVTAGYILITVLYIGSLIAGMYSTEIAMTMSLVICGFAALILVVNLVLRKLY